MPELSSALLTQHLNQFVVPQTGRALGSAGTAVAVAAEGAGWRVTVTCGYPLARSAPDLAAAIASHCAPVAGGAPIAVAVETAIVAHAVQHGLKPLPGVRNLVAVASGKGGVGKSTVAVNIALALAQEGARVGILDADIYGPSQPRMLGLIGRRPETRDGKSLEPLEAHGLEAMSIGFLVDEQQPMAWRGPMVTSALNQLLTQTNWGDLDYLIVDMPPGTGDIQLTLAQRVPVSGAVIVTTPQDIALADARKGLEMFQKVNVPVLGVVENMSLHVCSNCGHVEHIFGEHGGETLSSQYGVPLLGALPLDKRIREETDEGTPTVAADPSGALARAFRDVALRAVGELAARTKDYSRLFPSITVEDD
ncbi:MAG TPA: iron-sulfur cluster carrier protein ApbC [Gammaproteobacteria bacterium]|nr:iron-sulfur cluster carrier protein ApbC [Gammaproteobacteria bacterium]